MNKKQFKEILTELITIKKDGYKLNEAFRVFSPDFGHLSFDRYETLVVKSLSYAMNDTGDWISYFIYDRDCHFTKENIITDKDGKNLPFRNFNDLYNLIKN